MLEAAIKDRFGFDVPVIIWTSEELLIMLNKNPFYVQDANINQLHVTFLKEEPSKLGFNNTSNHDSKNDEFNDWIKLYNNTNINVPVGSII